MDWYNIFDLGEWDVYVQYLGMTEFPTPYSREYLVKAEDLDPNVGVVSVVNGEIVCEMENRSGSGGTLISVLVMPRDWTPDAAPIRITGGDVIDEELLPFQGSAGENSGAVVAYVDDVTEALPGESIYTPNIDLDWKLSPEEQMLNFQLESPLPSGYGAMGFVLSPGF